MAKTTTQMELVSIDKLIPYVNNARTHSAEQVNKLRASLREFGFINPVIVDRDLNVIAGHGRILAAREEGIKEVPCVYVDYLTEAQKKAYILAATVWLWMPGGMKNCCVSRSRLCRQRHLMYL